jgi:hypothetical protein
MASLPPRIDDSHKLTAWLAEESNQGQVVRTRLKASDRVIARVTDGIYREPAAALRELISNAWDADAKNVTIITDAPRFSRIYVRDDGAGMSYRTLSRLLHSIGGSAKRQGEGEELGITAQDDPQRTPAGRYLIGKIGIGLFSVSQLSRRFRIVTKVRGTTYRLAAEVRLRAYSEDGTADEDEERDDDDRYVSGDVYITREPADDIASHGTDIILDAIKPRVRDLLRSADRWRAIDERNAALAEGDLDAAINIRATEPQWHSGWIADLGSRADSADVFERPPHLPWTADDPPEARMGKMMDAVAAETTRLERPDLANTLDAYLEMLWTLALSSPVKYVDRHPFDLTRDDRIRLFWLSNEPRGQAVEIPLEEQETVREAVRRGAPGDQRLESGSDDPAGGFRVIIDGVELRRPIRFKFVQPDWRSLEHSLLFVGKYKPNLSRVNQAQRGGDLDLEGYLFWNGRIIPKENNGVLVRIRGAGGALFDPTFFKYQVSEQTRLRQITSELFIHEGLDAALNIDRESFNFAHPHVQLVATWLHRTLRQLTNRHKDISQRLREGRRDQLEAEAEGALGEFVEEIWQRNRGSDPPPQVVLAPNQERATIARSEGYLAVSRDRLRTLDAVGQAERRRREAQVRAVTSVLSAFGVLDDRTYDEQQALIDAILKIFVRF